MAQGDSEKSPQEESRWSRLSKTASFWILFLLLPILLIQMLGPGGEQAAEISYTRFDRQIDAGNIFEITVVEGTKVEGEFRTPVTVEGTESTKFTTTIPGEITEGLLDRLKEKDVTVNAEAEEQNWWGIFGSLLPWIIIIAFWIWFMRQMQTGGSKAFQFGKSKAKLLSPDTPEVNFSDVAGAEEAKQELEEVIDFLKDPDRFSRLGGRLPKGVLLVGPPGTGKTLLARAVAGEAGRPFFQMSGSDFVEMFVGVGASRVRDLFEQAKAQSPCIVFIDELDAVGRHRGAGLGGGHDEREQTLNQLLVEMDGFEPNEGVILIAATNRPDVLDPALLRPGRFDRQVVVDSPDRRGREGILRVHAKKVPLADDVDLSIIAKATPGLSGADLANIVNEAALLAARRAGEKVTMEDFEEAKDKVMLGTERRSLVLSDEERELTAYHEAGHALIGLRSDELDPVHKVTIVPRGRALGLTASIPEKDRHSYRKAWLEGQLAMLFGGRVAEEMIFGPEDITTGAGNDIQRATEMARRMVTKFGMSEAVGLMSVGDSNEEVFLGRELTQRREVSEHTAQLVDREVKRILDAAHSRARKILEENEETLHAIAQALLERESLDREEVELLAKGEPLPPLPEGEEEEVSLAGGSAEEDADPAGDAAGDDEGAEEAEGEEEEDDVVQAPAARLSASDPEPDASR